MKLNKIEPEFISKSNPRIGLITLGSDFRIEKDFNNIIYGRDIDLYVNRIHCYNPLTNETLAKMADDITDVTKDILPDQKIDCVAYGCTSGTIAAGYNTIKSKVNLAKPKAKVTTPITAAIKALNKLNINKISIFTPYTKTINDSVVGYFKKENININSLAYFDIESDLDIGKVDEKYLFEVLSKIDLEDSEALFVSCTALPVLSIIDKLEKKLNKVVLSSNQTLIWDSFNAINYKEKIEGFGKLFNS
jgi:maleate isomerase